MEHIKQAKDECFPTVLAMLSGVDVNKILADGKAMTPLIHSWSMFTSIGNPDDITSTYRMLARKYAPFLIDYCEPISAYEVAKTRGYMSYKDFYAQTLHGKGAALYVSRYLSSPGAHITAYEDGFIYCGNQDGPMTAREYWVKLASKSILCPFKVIPEP